MKKIGLVGGTFDPVHKGHIRLAYGALDSCGLDQVIFIPAASPPHKGELRVSSFRHRKRMLETAVAEEKRFAVSDIESSPENPSYTYLTLRQIKKSLAENSIHFIIGSDAFIEIESWKNWREVIVATNFIIAVRPGSGLRELNMLLEKYGFTPLSEKKWTQGSSNYTIEVLESDFADISSTDVRMRIKAGEGWERLLPGGVAEYIKTNKLYGPPLKRRL